MIFAEKLYQFLVENLMLLAEKCDDFYKNMLTIFPLKVDNFCWKILRFLQKNLMLFGRKFNVCCGSYIGMFRPHLYGRKYFLIFIKKIK